MIRRRTGSIPVVVLMLALLISVTGAAHQQQPQRLDRFKVEQALRILEMVHNEVKSHYYDPTFHGVNIDSAYAQAKEKMGAIDSMNRSFGIIADMLDSLQDSHTFFIPPPRPYSVEYGFRREIIGDKCFVTAVEPDSDAAKQGLRRGDQLMSINQFPLDRSSLWKLDCMYDALSPQPGLVLDVQSPGGVQRRPQVKSEIEHFNRQVSPGEILGRSAVRQEAERPRYQEFGDDLIIINLPNFEMSTIDLDTVISKIHKHKALILDMRGNPGGAVVEMEEILKNLFDHDVHVCDRVTKGGRKSENIKGFGGHAYSGKIVALVDSQSDSAAEVTSRVLQLEKRGTIVGDHSAGKVMEARTYVDQLGVDTFFGFGTSVTDADLIMSDGKSLENTGVMPDETVLPTALDLATGRDPALARAAAILGVTISSADAGKYFPYIWIRIKN